MTLDHLLQKEKLDNAKVNHNDVLKYCEVLKHQHYFNQNSAFIQVCERRVFQYFCLLTRALTTGHGSYFLSLSVLFWGTACILCPVHTRCKLEVPHSIWETLMPQGDFSLSPGYHSCLLTVIMIFFYSFFFYRFE